MCVVPGQQTSDRASEASIFFSLICKTCSSKELAVWSSCHRVPASAGKSGAGIVCHLLLWSRGSQRQLPRKAGFLPTSSGENRLIFTVRRCEDVGSGEWKPRPGLPRGTRPAQVQSHVAASRPIVPRGGTRVPPVPAWAGSRGNGLGELVLPCLCLS